MNAVRIVRVGTVRRTVPHNVVAWRCAAADNVHAFIGVLLLCIGPLLAHTKFLSRDVIWLVTQ
jgi:hypothetical protein